MNGAGVWLETGIAALSLSKEGTGDIDVITRRLDLAEESLKPALEVLLMRAQYFRDITEHGLEEARQMAFLVEQDNDAVYLESYRTAREALTSKLELEAAKKFAKTCLEKATGNNSHKGKKGGGAKGGAQDSE